ncbi:MAG: hypothetical protein J6W11_05490 [Alphaproteobacteria bacterium]|nr:hypothetical protein [Alphaproteobacteria bacterium]
MVKNFFSNFKKHIHILYYAIFACLSFYSVTMLISCYALMESATSPVTTTGMDYDAPVWLQRASRNLILPDKLVLAYFIFFIGISLVYVFNKKPKTAVFVQLIAYIIPLIVHYTE